MRGRSDRRADDAVSDGETLIQKNEYDGLNRRIKKHQDTDAPDEPDGEIDEYVHYFYNSSWQVLEERVGTGSENDQPENLDARYQYVWSLRYIDAPVCRDEDKNSDGDCIPPVEGEGLHPHLPRLTPRHPPPSRGGAGEGSSVEFQMSNRDDEAKGPWQAALAACSSSADPGPGRGTSFSQIALLAVQSGGMAAAIQSRPSAGRQITAAGQPRCIRGIREHPCHPWRIEESGARSQELVGVGPWRPFAPFAPLRLHSF